VELTILISARNWGSDYIWHAHYPAAVKGGLDPTVPADMVVGKKPGITAMALITANAPAAPGDEPKLQTVAPVFPK
jgi:hypothetical protein